MNAATEADPIYTSSIEDGAMIKEGRFLPKNPNFFYKIIRTLTLLFAEYKIAYEIAGVILNSIFCCVF